MSWDPDAGYTQDEEEEELEDQGVEGGKDREYIAFLVDCSKEMFEELPIKQEDGEEVQQTSFQLVVNTASDYMRKRIMAGAKDEFLVVLYNTEKTDNPNNQEHVTVYIKRDVPDADTIQRLSNLADEFERSIRSLPESSDPVASSDALKHGLWTTMDCLQANASKHARYRIIMFSNQEDPFGAIPEAPLRSQYRQMVLDRAAAAHSMGATMRFFPLIAAAKPFDMGRFWNALLAELRDPEDEYDPTQQSQASQPLTQIYAPGAAAAQGGPAGADDVMARLSCLSQYMRKAMSRRRATASLRWAITDSLDISCQVFDLFVEAKKPFACKLRARDNAPLQPESALVSEDTGALIPKIEFKSFKPEKAADRFPKVVFGLEEISAIKYYMGPGLKLLGFKPRSCLHDYHNITHSSFLRPTERDVRGSTSVFRALLHAMLLRDNIAICSYVRTKRSEPVLVALLPQKEETDAEGYQLWAEGLHMVRLPFKDDIRHADTDPSQVGTELPAADVDQVDAAKALVTKLQYLDFTHGTVSNPVLDRHFEVLEAVALNMEPPDEGDLVDGTLPPDPADIRKAAAVQLEKFKEAVQLGAEGAGGKGGGGAAKRKPAAGEDLSTAELYAQRDWASLVRDPKALSKLTIPDLKVYLKHHKLAQSGNKGNLVERIISHATGDV